MKLDYAKPGIKWKSYEHLSRVLYVTLCAMNFGSRATQPAVTPKRSNTSSYDVYQ